MSELTEFQKKFTVGAVLEAKYTEPDDMQIEVDAIPKYWLGSRVCDFCSMAYPQTLVDGKTTDGPWAIMCLECFKVHGVGLGTGRGQRYEWTQLNEEQGAYLKVEG
jgi:hypothetical protein